MALYGPRLVLPIDLKKKPWEQKLPLHNRWHPDKPPVAEVRTGELFRLEMMDFSGGRITKEYTAEDIKHAEPSIIYGYRMSLWAEHIGDLEECFNQPESIECMRRLRTLGEENWKQYVADEVTEMKGHLLKYPLEVDRMGKVNPLPGCKKFPDMGGKITGSTGLGLIDLDKNVTI